MSAEPIEQEPRKRGRPSVDLRGMKYGKLIPFEQVPRVPGEKGQTMWRCYCVGNHPPSLNLPRDCEVPYSALVTGKRRSCGCERIRRTYRSSGARVTRELATMNDLVAFGITPPEWMLTAEQARDEALPVYDGADVDELRRTCEELGIPFKDDTN